jgi:VCBS repeat-containing protein
MVFVSDFALDTSESSIDVWITLDTIRHLDELAGWRTQQVPNDPYFRDGLQWGLDGLYGSAAPAAWGQSSGSLSTVVGVVDTGIDMTHPDLYRNIWINQLEIPQSLRSQLLDINGDGLITFHDLNHSSNTSWVFDFNGNTYIDAYDLLDDGRWVDGIDNAGNGFIDDLFGWNFYDNNNRPLDDDGHGTHVAGTIGAMTHNALGVAGVNWDVQLMALRFMNPDGGFTSDAVRALDYFTWFARNDPSQHYVATNNSWGSGSYSSALLSAIGRGAQADVLFVAAAGNDGTNNDRTAFYPSNYNTLSLAGYDAVIAVAATTSAGGLALFSNFGGLSVDVGAPGVSILSTVPGGSYAYYSGTSMAAPHVAGAVALYASAHPQAGAAEIRDALLASVTAMSALNGKTVTGGRLNMDLMLRWDGQVVEPEPQPEPEPEPIPPTKPSLTRPPGITYTDTAANDVFSKVTGRLQASDINTGDVLRFGIVDVTPNINGIASKTGAYGQLSLNVNTGDFTFVPNNAAIQARKTNASESYMLFVTDGVPQTEDDIKSLVVSVRGAEDPTEFSGIWSEQVQEDARVVASGQVWATDRDAGDGQWVASQVQGGYGVFSIDGQGHWRYELDNESEHVQALGWGQQVLDRFAVEVSGGASKVLELTVLGSNDAPVLQALQPLVWLDTAQADVFGEVWGQLQAQDVDGQALVYGVQGGQAQQGLVVLDSRWGRLELEVDTGAYRFIPDAQAIEAERQEVSEMLTVYVSDGLEVSEQVLQVVVMGADDPTNISGDLGGWVVEDEPQEVHGRLLVEDRDRADAAMQAAMLQGEYGLLSMAGDGRWTYQLDNASSRVQALAAGQVVQDVFLVSTTAGIEQRMVIHAEGRNDGPAGTLRITGAPMVGQWLSVDVDLNDPEGLGLFGYQWLINGQPVPGADAQEFRLLKTHVGAEVQLRLSYVDGSGVLEEVEASASDKVVRLDRSRLIVRQVDSGSDAEQALYATASGRYVVDRAGLEGPSLVSEPLWLKNGKQALTQFKGKPQSAVFTDDGGLMVLSEVKGRWSEQRFGSDGRAMGQSRTLPLWVLMDMESVYRRDFNLDGLLGDVMAVAVDVDGYGTDAGSAGLGLYQSLVTKSYFVDAKGLAEPGAPFSSAGVRLLSGGVKAWSPGKTVVLGMAETSDGRIEVLMRSGKTFLVQGFDRSTGLALDRTKSFGLRSPSLPQWEPLFYLDLNGDGRLGSNPGLP